MRLRSIIYGTVTIKKNYTDLYNINFVYSCLLVAMVMGRMPSLLRTHYFTSVLALAFVGGDILH